MKILILADMEGVAGIVHWDQVDSHCAMYQEGRRLYTEEVNAAVRGAFSGGAREVVVVDTHGAGVAATGGGPAFNSIIPELMDDRCEFITHHGWGNYLDVMAEGWDAAFFVGIHARGGTPGGVLSHTVSSQVWLFMAINGQLVGEIGVMAACLGAWGIPMVLVTGDDKACTEARELLGEGLTTVQVKRGMSRYSARNMAPSRARRLIEAGAAAALKDLSRVKPFLPATPTEVRFEIVTADKVDPYRHLTGVEIQGDRTVLSKGENFLEAWQKVAPYR